MTAATRLFVGNLPNKVNENELRTAFSRFGEVTTLEIKAKPAVEDEKKLFAFVTLSASNYDIESCIKHFANVDLNGSRLYVTRARESFLERLQREREQAKRKEDEKNEPINTNHTPKPLNININSYKRKHETNNIINENGFERKSKRKFDKEHYADVPDTKVGDTIDNQKVQSEDDLGKDYKKQNSDKKRLESMRKKRQEFNEKKMIIKTGLVGIDKSPNKKVIFSDDDDDTTLHSGLQSDNSNNKNIESKGKRALFDDEDDSDNEVNFEVKKQFEGKKGQKVLDLQSRYKADKRFVLDERFIEDDKSDEESQETENKDEGVELGQVDEKYKQLNILQDVLGVPIKINQPQESVTKQTKSKMGMLRFDPSQPEHAKFLAPVTAKQEQTKKSKKKKSKENPEETVQEEPKEVEKVEVSKEQFYKVSETLKEAMTQPTSFSLRSLFGKVDTAEDETGVDLEITDQYTELKTPQSIKEKKVRNPLDPGEKNPFVYDSSESEDEEETKVDKEVTPQVSEPKPVWREKLFFSQADNRLNEGVLFFTQISPERAHKDRRELKSVMKKRVYNKERKNQMFQKKIGGRRKNPKKSFKRKG